MPDGKVGGLVPSPPRMFDTEELAKAWLLPGLHELATLHGFELRLHGSNYGDDVDRVLGALVVEEHDNAVLLCRRNSAGKKEYYSKLTDGGDPYFEARDKAVRFNGYSDPEMARVTALISFETFPEEA
jgi:hypothetical protein